jgi:hypothetical protein
MTVPAAMILADMHLSFRARAGHLALLLVALGMAALVAALLLTEPMLPARTVIALAAMLAIALAWSVYAVWVLCARKTMLAYQRMVAGRIAMGAAAIFTAGAALLGMTAQMPAAWAAVGLGAILMSVAAIILQKARREYQALLARRRELEALLASAR